MALYDIQSGQSAVASDVEQLINIFNGKHDIGNLSFAPPLSAPSSSNFTLATQAGSSLGIGAYNYQFTYVTGQYKSDGVTLVMTGETTVSASKSITTTSGNTNVLITLPTSSLPTSLIAINIYRTSVGGSDYKLIATVKAGSVNYTDSTSDASRSSATPPANNTTGTILSQYVRGGANWRYELDPVLLFTNGGATTASANVTFGGAFTTVPTIIPCYLANAVSNTDVIIYPYFYNVSTTGYSVRIQSYNNANLGNVGSPANVTLNVLVLGS